MLYPMHVLMGGRWSSGRPMIFRNAAMMILMRMVRFPHRTCFDGRVRSMLLGESGAQHGKDSTRNGQRSLDRNDEGAHHDTTTSRNMPASM